MRILLIEDSPTVARTVEKHLVAIDGCEVVWAKSRDSALARIENEHFDLVILDRRIPTRDLEMDDHPDHGWAVFENLKQSRSGTPVWFLTGSEDADFASHLTNDHSRSEDIHSRQVPEAMYLVIWKKHLDDLVARARSFNEKLSQVEIVAVAAANLNLSAQEQRILQLFGRRVSATSVEVSSLGGLSGARVVKAIAKSASGQTLLSSVAKIGALEDVRDEIARYEREIVRLAPAASPMLVHKMLVGAGNYGGAFYQLVGEQVVSVFKSLVDTPTLAAGVPAALMTIQAPWKNSGTVANVTVGTIRRRLLPDVPFEPISQQLGEIDFAALESVQLRALRITQHNDLHGVNVVFDQRGIPMLIDFNDTGPSFAAIDPVTLELSTAFHKDRSMLPDGWPTVEGMSHWPEVNEYVAGCAFPDFVRNCRAWATSVAGSPEEILAVAYGYGLRQFKYADTDKGLAKALVLACANSLLG